MQPSLRSAIGHFLFVNRLLRGDRGGPWRGFQLRRQPAAPPVRVEWASAACVLVRPAAIRESGGFDPAIFLYGEDVELGERLTAAGWEIWLEPGATARHSIAGSQGGVSTRWIDAIHRLYGRHTGRVALTAFDLVVALGLAIRAGAARGPEAALQRRRMGAGSGRALRLATVALLRGPRPEAPSV